MRLFPGTSRCRRRDSNPRHADYDSACRHVRSGLSAGDSSVRGQHMDRNVDRLVTRIARGGASRQSGSNPGSGTPFIPANRRFCSLVAVESAPTRRTRCSARLPLFEAEGWRLRHSLPWQGRGDIDSVAIAPTGIAVAIETKTRSYDQRHLARVREQVAWLSATPAKVGSQRGTRRGVHRPRTGRRAGRARRPSGLGRPVGACPSRRGGDASSARLTRLIGTVRGDRGSAGFYPGD